jgi:hypothetical protein
MKKCSRKMLLKVSVGMADYFFMKMDYQNH